MTIRARSTNILIVIFLTIVFACVFMSCQGPEKGVVALPSIDIPKRKYCTTVEELSFAFRRWYYHRGILYFTEEYLPHKIFALHMESDSTFLYLDLKEKHELLYNSMPDFHFGFDSVNRLFIVDPFLKKLSVLSDSSHQIEIDDKGNCTFDFSSYAASMHFWGRHILGLAGCHYKSNTLEFESNNRNLAILDTTTYKIEYFVDNPPSTRGKKFPTNFWIENSFLIKGDNLYFNFSGCPGVYIYSLDSLKLIDEIYLADRSYHYEAYTGNPGIYEMIHHYSSGYFPSMFFYKDYLFRFKRRLLDMNQLDMPEGFVNELYITNLSSSKRIIYKMNLSSLLFPALAFQDNEMLYIRQTEISAEEGCMTIYNMNFDDIIQKIDTLR